MPEASASLPPAVAVIGGVDPTGGAGLGADLAVLQSFGCQALPVPTAWTVQDGLGVHAAGALPAEAVAAMLAPLGDLAPAAVKVGMLADAALVDVVAAWLAGLTNRPKVVVDPVVLATGGAPLLTEPGVEALRTRLLPLADLVTPNLDEARLLAPTAGGDPADLARALVDDGGARAAVVTGLTEVLHDGERLHRFERAPATDAHGTGCRYASGCAAGLALGRSVAQACEDAGAALALALAGPRRGAAGLLTIPP